MSGTFLVFEGIDGSGKSTQARRVAHAHDALLTFEPGDTVFGAELRRWALDGATSMDATTEALVMLADRSHHVDQVIRPALDAGRSIVSDRYFGSTLAYQGYGRGVDLARLRSATELAVGSYWPTLTLLLDVPLDVVNERRDRDARDRFEGETLTFHQRVREGYVNLARELGWVVVDAAQSEADVAREVDQLVADLPW